MKTLLIATLAGTALTFATIHIQPRYVADEVHQITFTVESSSTMVEMRALMNGEENPGMPDMERGDSSKLEGSFRDLVTRVDGDLLAAFDREYLEILETSANHMSDPMMGDVDQNSEKTTPLGELTVQFAHGEEGFEASFPGDTSEDEQLLEGLTGPVDFTGLLPAGEVDVDDEWAVSAESIWSFFEPGGNLSLEDSNPSERLPSGVLVIDARALPAELDGDCTASLAEIREVDGARCAVIALSIEFTRSRDLTEMMAASADRDPEDMPEGAVMPDVESFETETAYEGDGTLVWNLEAGVASSLEINVESERTETMLMVLGMGPEDLEIEQTMIFEGETALSYEVEVTHE
jgi:hypothetical protein